MTHPTRSRISIDLAWAVTIGLAVILTARTILT